eukprot:CAMPEP_0184504138 /NCGR_PEP_ID=MMETSP0113_2-20130426/52291_1 /TAXON_ID=91329 /ORGANISM="Norrisiella sphaerica, Strain BC52" /LENGTH=498 /DNA_ID=CAMNT_0026893755 /DNA_START=293 /DNA_END=1790 /DNA_ORIENTATION=-
MEGRDFEAVEKILEKFHAGHYLVVVIGSRILRDCPAGVLDSAKIDFENPDSLSDVISACQSIDRWLLADSSNITVICADRPQIGKLLSCYFYYTLHQKALKKEVKAEVEWKGEPEEILKGTEPAQPKKPSLRRFSSATPPRRTVKLLHSQKRFIKDFKMAVDNGFNSAGDPLILKELVIERLPPADSNGAKISVLIQQNKRFAFSTMQRGGVIWLPATKAEPATACIPIRALVKDDALIKVYHHPDHATTNRPQKLLFKVRVYMDVARKRGYLLRFEKSEIDETATKESYSNRFRFQTLFEEPETKNPSPYAEPHSKKAQAARKYWDEMKKRKGYTYISRVDPLTLLAEREKERENERTGARATESKEDTKAPKDDKKGLESGLNEMSTSAEELKGDEERNSAPVEEPLDDFQLAQRLQNQYNQEAKEYGEAGEGEQGNFTGDEAYARQLQMQMDSEVRESRVEMLLRTGAIEPRQLNYEQLLELDENINAGTEEIRS